MTTHAIWPPVPIWPPVQYGLLCNVATRTGAAGGMAAQVFPLNELASGHFKLQWEELLSAGI